MTQVTNYHVLVYGSPSGYQTNRSQITLYNGNDVIAYVRFNDQGMNFEDDYVKDNIIRMHLPSSMFQSVLDILRNEKPMNIYFVANRAFLGTGKEPVGEEERS
ncbi:hypothetical protein GF319_04080 [Candidatus Bathyarchaeota archaeon]|nr:hypothetical protein [Candidatus Bathyarchaeota archaeon]